MMTRYLITDLEDVEEKKKSKDRTCVNQMMFRIWGCCRVNVSLYYSLQTKFNLTDIKFSS